MSCTAALLRGIQDSIKEQLQCAQCSSSKHHKLNCKLFFQWSTIFHKQEWIPMHWCIISIFMNCFALLCFYELPQCFAVLLWIAPVSCCAELYFYELLQCCVIPLIRALLFAFGPGPLSHTQAWLSIQMQIKIGAVAGGNFAQIFENQTNLKLRIKQI